MIFVSLGSQEFQFNRLLRAMDRLLELGRVDDEVFAQIGHSDYIPRNYSYVKFLDRSLYMDKLDAADIVITHGGTGAIVNAVKRGKKVIAVPRLSKYGEHVDDHQLQIVEQFRDLNLLCMCEDVDELEQAIQTVKQTTYQTYVSNSQAFIDDISEYLDSVL